MVKYREKEFKSAFNKLKFPDSWFWIRYTINPYSGCEHRCIYCDARSERYYLSQDFEDEIIIKRNIDKKLDRRIKNARTLLPDIIGAGGVNDAYQPIEEKVNNTRKILMVLRKYKYPVNIATKSKLILRDIDILNDIAKQSWSTIGFSISTTNEKLAKFLEPYSSIPKERIRAIKKIKQKAPNIQVGTYFMPIIPYLEDNDENIQAVIGETKDAGADFILFSPGLTLRDSQKDFFLKKLKNSEYNHIIEPLLDLYKGNTYPPMKYTNRLNRQLLTTCRDKDIAIRIKRWIPSDYRKWNYKISEILLNKEYIDNITTGMSNKTMKWAGLYLNNLKESILNVYKRGGLLKLKNFNRDILKYIKPILDGSKDLTQKKGLEKYS